MAFPVTGSNQLCVMCAQTRVWARYDSQLNVYMCANCVQLLTPNYRGGGNGGFISMANFAVPDVLGATWATVLAPTGTKTTSYANQWQLNPSLAATFYSTLSPFLQNLKDLLSAN